MKKLPIFQSFSSVVFFKLFFVTFFEVEIEPIFFISLSFFISFQPTSLLVVLPFDMMKMKSKIEI